MPRRVTILLLGLAVAGLAPASAETPPLVLTPRHDAAHALTWEGWAELAPAGRRDPAFSNASTAIGAQHASFVARLGSARRARATLWIGFRTAEDLAVRVESPDGKTLVAESDNPPGRDEVVSFVVDNGAQYLVRVIAKAGAPVPPDPQFRAALWIRQLLGTSTGIGRRLAYNRPNVCGDRPQTKVDSGGRPYVVHPPPCYATIKMPVTLVFVGFDRTEVDEHVPDVAGVFPDHGDPRTVRFKPVVADESAPGGAGVVPHEGGAQVRELALVQGTRISSLPVAYDFGEPRIVVATEKYSRSLFAAAKAATTPGTFAHPWDRAYLEAYNARSAAFRRESVVAPGSQVDFVDALRLEDWIARNPPPGVTLNPAKASGGFTYFVLDTYRAPYANEYFRTDRYHNFRVMNERTRDPDTGEQRGFDWGRVWGGRHRFLMLDT
ncbi:MAG: hypothetical protein ACRDJM_06525, partial [Actinomycetota bacterium]